MGAATVLVRDIWEEVVGEYIWTHHRESERRMEKITQLETNDPLSPNIVRVIKWKWIR
jgi:hypothetical protein